MRRAVFAWVVALAALGCDRDGVQLRFVIQTPYERYRARLRELKLDLTPGMAGRLPFAPFPQRPALRWNDWKGAPPSKCSRERAAGSIIRTSPQSQRCPRSIDRRALRKRPAVANLRRNPGTRAP
ncbi:hypothetical protein HRbin33_00535 [bacterium HR33]|nr:hypothetical protein HRbin33_00535 [bacterium HR33]